MSRGTVTKSRTEKKGGVSVPTPAIAHEIIPGKYTDQDWNAMLEKEDGEEFIGEILQELMQQTMQKAYDSYINRQLLPFTISQAKDAILQIIEWQFLAHDDGESEVDKDLGWIPDEEPDPATTDCWAQGSVPKFFLPPPPPVIEEEPEEISEEVCPGEGEEAPGVEEEQVSETASVEEPPVVIETEEPEAAPETLPESPKEEVLKKKRSGYKPHLGRLPSAGVSKMTESLEDTEIKLWEQEARQSMSPEKGVDLSLIQMPISCHSLLRMQQGRPPGNKEVVYDEMGNVIAVVKLNPDRLPTHRVKVGYHIVDPTVEAAEARLDAMKKGRLTRKESQMKAAKHKTGKRGSMVSSSVVSGVTHTTLSDSESKTPLPPALIDTVDLAPGVIIREGQQVRKGPRRFVKKSNQLTEETERMLKPISLCTTLPSVDVSEILERRTPVLKPIRETPPIPPINPYPPQQPRVA